MEGPCIFWTSLSTIRQALSYLKSYDKVMKISIAKGLSSEDILKFSNVFEIQGHYQCVTEKNISDGKEITENRNGRSEPEFALVEDLLHIHRTVSNKTTLVSVIPNIILEENFIIAPGQRKKTVSVLCDGFYEEQAFSYHLPNGKFGYNVPRNRR